MRVLVCGSRYWKDEKKIIQRLKKLPEGTIIIAGGCRGADIIAETIALKLNMTVWEYPADWKTYGLGAGRR